MEFLVKKRMHGVIYNFDWILDTKSGTGSGSDTVLMVF